MNVFWIRSNQKRASFSLSFSILRLAVTNCLRWTYGISHGEWGELQPGDAVAENKPGVAAKPGG